MDGMFGLQSPPDYVHRPVMPPDGLFDCSYSYHGMIPSLADDRIPMLGSDDLTAASGCFHCSVDSEAGSVTPDAHWRGGERLDDAAAERDDLGYDNDGISLIKAQIAAHPSYPKLLEAYIDCQKVGAPPEVATLLDEIRRENGLLKHDGRVPACSGDDIELDIFMETYCDILVKYKSDLSRPFHETTNFLNNIESQLSNICKEDENSNEAISSEDGELKNKLLEKYGGHISSLKLEFSKKRKKGKLPKDARHILLEWWKEADKVTLAEMTGLDQKQINNWFINQRKRHWRPSEHMQVAVMDNLSAAAGQFHLLP